MEVLTVWADEHDDPAVRHAPVERLREDREPRLVVGACHADRQAHEDEGDTEGQCERSGH
jgi:hypothetical protein